MLQAPCFKYVRLEKRSKLYLPEKQIHIYLWIVNSFLIILPIA